MCRDAAVRSLGMSSEVATALGSAFVASILTTVGSRWIAGFQSKKASERESLRRDHEREQARLADERSLRDGKRERLRGDYFAIAYAADTIASVAKELGVLWGGDTEDARNDRLNKRLQDATEELGRAILRLRLEEGTQPMVDSFRRLRAAWFQYSDYELPRLSRDHNYEDITDVLTRIETEVQAIVGSAKADLERLGKPI